MPETHRPDGHGLTDRARSLAFFTLVIALVLEIVDLTIVNTALPAIQRDFAHGVAGGAAAQAQWVVAGYSLSFAVLLILGGRLGDLFGPRAMFLLGVGGFTLASVLCGLSQSANQLVAARVAQGAFGAVMAPQVLALIQVLYDPVERIGRLAWFGVIGGLSAILGPILGGLLIAANLFGLGWRTVFLINAPVGLVAIAAAMALLPRSPRHTDARVDLAGTVLFGGALFALLFPLVRGDRLHWGVASWACLGAAAVLGLCGWRGLKRRAASGAPVLFDPVLLGNGLFRQGLEVSLTFSAANTGFLFIFALAIQQRVGFTPLQAGLVHIPFSVGVMLGIAVIGRRYLERAGRSLLLVGVTLLTLFFGATLGWIALGGPGLAILLPLLLLAGVGMGTVSGPISPVALSRVDRAHAGAASGLLKTVQEMGAALGVALIGSAYFAFGAQGNAGVIAALVVDEVLLLACAACILRLPRVIFPENPS